MLYAVRSSDPRFKSLEGLRPGLNIVVAEKHKESTELASRNGTGKSSLLEVIHFVLGARNITLPNKIFKDWKFSLDLVIDGYPVRATREVGSSDVSLVFHTNDCVSDFTKRKWTSIVKLDEWKSMLGSAWFGLDEENEDFAPLSFRSLIHYFIRNEEAAYNDGFRTSPKIPAANIQVFNAYLLNLGWEFARDLGKIHEKEKAANQLMKATKAWNKENSSEGKLEADKILLAQKIHSIEEDLKNFRVHPHYLDLQKDADKISVTMQELKQTLFQDRQLLRMYLFDSQEVNLFDFESLKNVYESAKVEIPEMVKKNYSDVESFHKEIVRNRKKFLNSEVQRLKQSIQLNEEKLKDLDANRANILQVLESHKALEDLVNAQNTLGELKSKFNEIENKIENIKKIEEVLLNLKRGADSTKENAKKDNEERYLIRERAIQTFNQYSEYIYEAAGQLIIEVNSGGYKFDVEIQGGDSTGKKKIGKTFCYDLMLAALWSRNPHSPRLLIHDSLMFDGVDSRQIGKAIELVSKEAVKYGYMYLMLINSDDLAKIKDDYEINTEYPLEQYIRLHLSDDDVGGLFGFKF